MLESVTGDQWLALVAFGAAAFKHVVGYLDAKVVDPNIKYDAKYLSQTISAGIAGVALIQGAVYAGMEFTVWTAAMAWAVGTGTHSTLSKK